MILDLTQTEENYLKAIFSLSLEASKAVSTNAISEQLATKASSVTDMVKKLSEKKLVNYKKYQGVALTVLGREIAVKIIRKHRLWEVFLVKHLDFSWDEVHDVAEQLEHVKSIKLVKQLDAFLEYPTHDPHGDPIPDADGNIPVHTDLVLASLDVGASCIIIGVKDTSTSFLKYLDSSGITLGTEIALLHKEDFDNSMSLQMGAKQLSVSHQITKNLLVKKIEL
tara:strand:+ start:1234 stop:1905 length:672 start_codon:yes stop_codon:yes gene_type:complete